MPNTLDCEASTSSTDYKQLIQNIRLFDKEDRNSEFITIFYFALDKPLQIWEKKLTGGGIIKRIIDMTDNIPALQILGSKVLNSYITTPPANFTTLGITLPYLGVISKYFGRVFAFEVQVLDSLNAKRRIHFSTVQPMTRRNAQILHVPLHLEIGWNELKIDLNYLLRIGYGTRYKETVRVQIFPNCYLRAIYFSAISIPNNHAVNIIRKSLYTTNQPENSNPEQLKLVEYKASNFSLLIPTNLEEFSNLKSVQNILTNSQNKQNSNEMLGPINNKSTPKSDSIATSIASGTSKTILKKQDSSTKTRSVLKPSSRQDIIFSISPIIPRSTSQLLVLKEANETFINALMKNNEKTKPKTLAVRSSTSRSYTSIQKAKSSKSVAAGIDIKKLADLQHRIFKEIRRTNNTMNPLAQRQNKVVNAIMPRPTAGKRSISEIAGHRIVSRSKTASGSTETPGTDSATKSILKRSSTAINENPLTIKPGISFGEREQENTSTTETLEPFQLKPSTVETLEPFRLEPSTVETLDPFQLEPSMVETLEPFQLEPSMVETLEPFQLKLSTEETMDVIPYVTTTENNSSEIEDEQIPRSLVDDPYNNEEEEISVNMNAVEIDLDAEFEYI